MVGQSGDANVKYYLWYNYGGCNTGDHSTGVEEFSTLAAAHVRVEELKGLDCDVSYVIYLGNKVEESE